MQYLSLPADLPGVPPAHVCDPDGEIERAVAATALRGDNIGAARLALTIAHPFRRAAWLANFRPKTIDAARDLAAAPDG